jgi:drug/metabolite transporter (DMT)-like permease
VPAPPRDVRADLALAAAAFLFGTTFLVVQDAVEADGAIPFLVARFALGALALLPFAVRRGRPAPGLAGAATRLGGLLFLGYVLQTVGLEHTTSSVSAFITYLLVVFVPILSSLVLRSPPGGVAVASVALAVVGLLLLTAGASGEGLGGGLGRGELLTLGCAVAFAGHIVVLADAAPRFDIVQLNLGQFAVVSGTLLVPGAVVGGYDLSARTLAAAAYTGVVVSAVAFGLQVWGQRRVSATRTALVLLLEPVFAAVLGLVAGERLGALGALGAGVILLAILLSEVGGPWRARRLDRAPGTTGTGTPAGT